MNIRITNATGKNIYYRVIDYEGPFVDFAESRLPGMYPATQSDFTDSDEFYSGNNTKIGDRRYTLSSRYPKFSQPKQYMSNFSDGQQPSARSYKDVSHNYPSTTVLPRNGRSRVTHLDGNHEGVIPLGKSRDLMLRDMNCNLYIRTFGEPIIQKFSWAHDPEHVQDGNSGIADNILASSLAATKRGLQPNDPRLHEYETLIKVARIRETSLIMCLRFGNWDFMYDETGQRFTSQYPQDCTFIGMIRLGSFDQSYSGQNFNQSYSGQNFNQSYSGQNGLVRPSYPSSEIGNPNPIPLSPAGTANSFTTMRPAQANPTITRGRYAETYPYASIDSLPLPYYGSNDPAYHKYGTYIDRLRNEAEWREFKYSTANPDMTSYNYSDDYDKPILGYFDRRWLYSGKYQNSGKY